MENRSLRDVDAVDPGRLERWHDLLGGVLERDALFSHQLIRADPDQDGVIRSHRLSHSLEYGGWKAQSILPATAVLVLPPVVVGGNKGTEQGGTSVGAVQLHTIHAGGLQSHRVAGELLAMLLDLLDGEL